MGSLQEAFTLINVDPQVQNIITGVLLLFSVLVPNLPEFVRRARRELARRRGPRVAPGPGTPASP